MVKSVSNGRFNYFLSKTVSFVINPLFQIASVKLDAVDLKA